jgi:hypothetical protein
VCVRGAESTDGCRSWEFGMRVRIISNKNAPGDTSVQRIGFRSLQLEERAPGYMRGCLFATANSGLLLVVCMDRGWVDIY